MSRSRSSRRSKVQIEAGSGGSGKQIFITVIIVLLIGSPFFVARYIEFNSAGPFDSSSYVYSAKHILEGAEIGTEERTSAQVGTLLVNILGVWLFGFSEAGPKFIQSILQGAAIILMFFSMRKLFGLLAATVGAVVAAVYLGAPVIAKFGNVKEQYMIAFMMLGVSCFVFRQLEGKWWWGILAGAFLAWGPLFKQTGLSAIGAVGIFIVVQPFLKHRSWKQTGLDILLLLAGAAISLGPIFIWIGACDIQIAKPYNFLWKMLVTATKSAGGGGTSTGGAAAASGYVAKSRKFVSFSEQAPRVLRYYLVLIVPISIALGAVVIKITKQFRRIISKELRSKAVPRPGWFVLLFAVWWLLDMGFVWVSARPYEQYYLPLNASAAMLGGYLFWFYREKISRSIYKGRWRLAVVVTAVLIAVMSQHIFFGLKKSPYSNTVYKDSRGEPARRKGYAQSLTAVASYRKGYIASWEKAAEYIRTNSTQDDTIYVWGWFPGIYVKAQRLSCVPKAFESEMHTKTPVQLRTEVWRILEACKRDRPKFIVDPRHGHFPYDGRLLELWPITEKGPLPANNKEIIAWYEAGHRKNLADRYGEDEAVRFEVMKELRDYIMGNYEIVGGQNFGRQVLFRLKQK